MISGRGAGLSGRDWVCSQVSAPRRAFRRLASICAWVAMVLVVVVRKEYRMDVNRMAGWLGCKRFLFSEMGV